jgi:predicted amidohydrolase
MNKFVAAAIQLDSTADKAQNIKNAIGFIQEAVGRGAKYIAMPEQMNYAGPESADAAEEIPGGPTFLAMAEQAQKYNVWLHCGSIYEKNSEPGRSPYNTTMLINPRGELAAKYSKLHPFDVVIKDGPSIKESDRICPGNKIVTCDTGEIGHIGFSICYDIRFAELYRLMALEGAQILMAPADFVLNTGKDHWEPLLRARAIENGCYVIAPGQCGIKPRFHAYGKSLIVDPWGNVVAKASDKPCVITAEIDLDYLESVRNQIFTLQNRRSDIYRLTRV